LAEDPNIFLMRTLLRMSHA